jgi:hypothetical protein
MKITINIKLIHVLGEIVKCLHNNVTKCNCNRYRTPDLKEHKDIIGTCNNITCSKNICCIQYMYTSIFSRFPHLSVSSYKPN